VGDFIVGLLPLTSNQSAHSPTVNVWLLFSSILAFFAAFLSFMLFFAAFGSFLIDFSFPILSHLQLLGNIHELDFDVDILAFARELER